jgi:wobble nucleotide-excising tRNase
MGFNRFHLETTDSVIGGYQIVRNDGSLAVDSLSEGEKSFICFTYFWESLRGSSSSGNQPENVVAVIDDPISSLDSDTLFMVAAYVRTSAQDIESDIGANIRQLIVLTHNVQFHHEASYIGTESKKGVRRYFRLVKQSDGNTHVIDDGEVNKIAGTYSLLWQTIVDVANRCEQGEERGDNIARVAVANVVRRIIEGYFTTIGSRQDYDLLKDLPISDRRIIDTFTIWANAGSHTITDDIYQTVDLGSTVQFLKLFRKYFDAVGHAAHFEMMIRASGGSNLLCDGQVFADTHAKALTSNDAN